MYVIYGLLVLLYLISNIIITITWMSDGGYRKKWVPAITIVLLLFGTPILIIVLVWITVATAIELIKGAIHKNEQ